MSEELPFSGVTETLLEVPLYLLCVDDDADILKSLTRVFRHESFKVLTAPSGREALAIMEHTENIGLILSDQRMPEMTGSTFLQLAKKLAPEIPRMILTGQSDMVDAIEAINQGGAQKFLEKPWDDAELLRVVRESFYQYRLIKENQHLHETVKQQNILLEEWNSNLKHRVLQQTALVRTRLEEVKAQKQSIQETSDALLLMFVDLMNRCNRQLGNDNQIVVNLAESMMATLQLPSAQREEIKIAAFIHDIGLFHVSDYILNSCPSMGSAEYGNHSVKGEELLAAGERLKGIGLIVRHHHEEYDGSGFPDGLAGEKIPMGSRIIRLASFIDTAYARETGVNAAYEVNSKLAAGMGIKFDPALAEAAHQAVKEVLHAVDRNQGE